MEGGMIDDCIVTKTNATDESATGIDNPNLYPNPNPNLDPNPNRNRNRNPKPNPNLLSPS